MLQSKIADRGQHTNTVSHCDEGRRQGKRVCREEGIRVVFSVEWTRSWRHLFAAEMGKVFVRIGCLPQSFFVLHTGLFAYLCQYPCCQHCTIVDISAVSSVVRQGVKQFRNVLCCSSRSISLYEVEVETQVDMWWANVKWLWDTLLIDILLGSLVGRPRLDEWGMVIPYPVGTIEDLVFKAPRVALGPTESKFIACRCLFPTG